jgi:hypothetical protein
MLYSLPYIFNFQTISKRSNIIIDNVEIVDLVTPIVEIEKKMRTSKPPILVTKEFEGRPHLISEIEYGSADYTDLLLLYNGIPNPFMVKEGMRLIIYELEDMLSNIKEIKDKNLVDKKSFSNKIGSKDEKRLKKLISKNNKISENDVEIRSTNDVATGGNQTTVDDGKIILGTDVTNKRCTDAISETQSLTENIRKAVKDALKNT